MLGRVCRIQQGGLGSFSIFGRLFTTRASGYKTVKDFSPEDLKGKTVFLRADLNVPITKEADAAGNFSITDDTRIVSAVPTIKHLMDQGARVILSSHMGRPKGKRSERLSLKPVAERLQELLGNQNITRTDDVIGAQVDDAVNTLEEGHVLLLENLRFHAEEEKNDASFARELAKHADIFINDAFGAAHRAHASTAGVAPFVHARAAGLLMEEELAYLQGAVEDPIRPFAAIIGGAKVSTKIPVIERLLDKVNKLFIGGGMMFTFYKARGYEIGSSLVEADKVDLARDIEQMASDKGVKLLLPTDAVVATECSTTAESKIVEADAIPSGWMGLDIGPKSIEIFDNELADCRTIIWNGPMGVFEFDKFAKGTLSIAQILAKATENGATTIVGGGDSVAAVNKSGLSSKMSHISTGGGASLELLEGKALPGVVCLDRKST